MKSRNSKLKSGRLGRKGQVMLLSILTLGAVMLGATAVSGFLVIYQIRMTSDIADSTKAIFAADAGIDWANYQFAKATSTSALQAPVFTNGASFTTVCYDSSLREMTCKSTAVSAIRSSGRSGMSYRSFELGL